MSDHMLCYVCCLYDFEYAQFAVTQVNGTPVCKSHLRNVGNAGIITAAPSTDWVPGDPIS